MVLDGGRGGGGGGGGGGGFINVDLPLICTLIYRGRGG